MKEERFSAFRLHKEHKGIIILFGIFALLFSAFYLSLLVDWKPKGAAELGKFAACVGLIYMAPGLMCSLLGGILLAGQKKRGYFLLILRNFPGLAAAVLTAGIVGFFSSICAVVGLFLGGSGRVRTQKERDKEWEKFAESGVGYAVNAEENAPALIVDNRRGRTEEAAMVLSGGLMASLSNLMLCGGMGEGKLPGRALDRSLEVYVRLKVYFDKLIFSGVGVAVGCLMTAVFTFLYDDRRIVGPEALGGGRRSENSLVFKALARWAGAAGMAAKPMPADFMGFALWLLVLAVVCMYGYHFYRCFRLYCWNDSWEETYRGKLETAGVASHISTVTFPEW